MSSTRSGGTTPLRARPSDSVLDGQRARPRSILRCRRSPKGSPACRGKPRPAPIAERAAVPRHERTVHQSWETGGMRVLVAMSGGVDSSVAAALLTEQGHEVVGATMKLWGGASDSGCCSVADVTDARRVCDDLGVDHRVFNFTEEFGAKVVDA